MKKSILLISAIFIFLSLIVKDTVSFAAEAKVGVAAMYDWWKPGFMKMENETGAKLLGLNVNEQIAGSYMMGPTAWVKINGIWSVGATLMIGITKNTFGYTSIPLAMTWWSILSTHIRDDYLEKCFSKSKSRRYDTDVNFYGGLLRYFNLLLGLRFNYYDGDSKAFRIFDTHTPGPLYTSFNVKDNKYSAWYLGPSVGAGFHYDIEGFSINLGASFIFQFGDYFLQKKVYFPIESYILPFNYKVGYVAFGLDNFLKLAYLIAPINIELSVGGRYIFLAHESAGSDHSQYDLSYKRNWINGQIEHFWGVTFGAAYKI